MKKTSAHVPATRGLEVANVIAKAEAKGLVIEVRSEAFLEMLEGVDIDANTATFAHAYRAPCNWRGDTNYPPMMPPI